MSDDERDDAGDAASGFGPAPAAESDPRAWEIPGYPGWTAGDFVNGNGLLGMRRPPRQDPYFQLAAMRTRRAAPADDLGPVQTATRAVNGVPLAIYQPQPSETGSDRLGDVAGLIRSLSRLSPSVLERFSNANIPFISVPDSVDQAFPNAKLLEGRPAGYGSDRDWGDVAGRYVDFRELDKERPGFLSPTDPRRAVVVGSPKLTSSYDVGLHEIGHPWDDLSGVNGRAASQLPSFEGAYAAEVPNLRAQAEARAAAMDSAHKEEANYYLPRRSSGTDVGAREAYAESFARYIADDPTLKADWPSLYAYWEARDRAEGLRSTPAQRGQ